MEYQCISRQPAFKFLTGQSDRLIVIIRTRGFEIYGFSHAPLFCTDFTDPLSLYHACPAIAPLEKRSGREFGG